MMGVSSWVLVAVAVSSVMWKCHAESEAERNERYSTARRLQIYPEAQAKYYLVSRVLDRGGFVETVARAASVITNEGCVQLTRTMNPAEAQIIIGENTGRYADDREYCTQSGYEYSVVYYKSPLPGLFEVLRTFLMCLAPLKFEFQRWDRDKYVYINWAGIIPGQERLFVMEALYPPAMPGFPAYSHGNLVNRDLRFASLNGTMTIIPKGSLELKDYAFPNYEEDLKRLHFYYKELLFPHPYKVWGFYQTYEMKPKQKCLDVYD